MWCLGKAGNRKKKNVQNKEKSRNSHMGHGSLTEKTYGVFFQKEKKINYSLVFVRETLHCRLKTENESIHTSNTILLLIHVK